jgi:hypothetical protein
VDYKAAFQKAVDKATYNELLTFAGIEPGADLSQVDPEKIDEAISLCHHLNKERPSNRDAEISFHDILAIRAESIPSGDGRSGKDNETAGADSQPERSNQEIQAIERIVRLCGHGDHEGEASWRRALSEIDSEDLLDWNEEPDEKIREVARLSHGNLQKGLRQALRIVRDVIDDQTRLGHFKHLCISRNGSFQLDEGVFYSSIVRFDREQIERRFRDLLRDTEHYPALERALAQNSISEARLKVLHSMPDEELKYFILCALYAVPTAETILSEAEADIPFDEPVT